MSQWRPFILQLVRSYSITLTGYTTIGISVAFSIRYSNILLCIRYSNRLLSISIGVYATTIDTISSIITDTISVEVYSIIIGTISSTISVGI